MVYCAGKLIEKLKLFYIAIDQTFYGFTEQQVVTFAHASGLLGSTC